MLASALAMHVATTTAAGLACWATGEPGSLDPRSFKTLFRANDTTGQVMVNHPNKCEYVPLPLRGFSFSPAAVGEGSSGPVPPGHPAWIEWDAMSSPDRCVPEFKRMRELHMNVVFMYEFLTQADTNDTAVQSDLRKNHTACLDAAWNMGDRPIFAVIALYVINDLPTTRPEETASLELLKSRRFPALISETSVHPTVLGYSVGSEITFQGADGWTQWNAVKTAARRSLTASNTSKLLTSAHIANVNLQTAIQNHALEGLDLFGLNVYQQIPEGGSPSVPSFWNLAAAAGRGPYMPIWFPEYGCTYQNGGNASAYADDNWVGSCTQIKAHTPPSELAIATEELRMVLAVENFTFGNGTLPSTWPAGAHLAGGALFEWSDELWKGQAFNPDMWPAAWCVEDAGAGTGGVGTVVSGWEQMFGKRAVVLPEGCAVERTDPGGNHYVDCTACVSGAQWKDRVMLTGDAPNDFGGLPAAWRGYAPEAFCA